MVTPDLLVDDVEAVEGNVSRDLWKVCAWGMAADVSAPSAGMPTPSHTHTHTHVTA